MLIGEDLHFNMSRIDQRSLDVDFAISEGPPSFALCCLQRRPEVFFRVHQTHTFTATACGRLEHHGVADFRSHSSSLLNRIHSAGSTGDKRNTFLFHGLAGAGL